MFRFLFILFISGTLSAQTKDAELERSTYAERIYQETVIGPKLKLYKKWLEKFPPRKFPHSLALYDFLKLEMAKAYIKQKNIDKALNLVNDLKVEPVKAEIWSALGNALYEAKFPEQAEKFYRMAWDNAYTYVKSGKTDPASAAIISRFPEYAGNLSSLLLDRRKEKEALHYAKISFENSDKKNEIINEMYLTALVHNGNDSMALTTGESLVLSGIYDYDLRDFLWHLVWKHNGQDSGLRYYNRLFALADPKRRSVLTGEMVNIPAPIFTLKDLEGKNISLSELKGKTVVLDFWATWCIPCLESFQYMNRLVEGYKDDSLVTFLFIHTWEKQNNVAWQVQNLLKSRNLEFKVLLDLKDPKTEVNNVVENYNIEALPAKVIIDRSGNIRFLKIANWKKESSDGNAVEELAAMIELVKALEP